MIRSLLCQIAIRYAEAMQFQENNLYFILIQSGSATVIGCIKDDELVLDEFTSMSTSQMETHLKNILVKNKISHECLLFTFIGNNFPSSRLVYPFSFTDISKISASCTECCFCFRLE